MGAILFRTGLRQRWASTLLIILLLAVAVGATLATAVGARRTATAFPRFAEQLLVPDLVVYVGSDRPEAGGAIRDQPQVAVAGVGTGVGLMPRLPDGTPDFDNALGAIVSDGVYGVDIDRPLILDGRLPRDDAPYEVMLDEKAASVTGTDVGDVLPALTFDVEVIMQKVAEFERLGREPTEAEMAEVFAPVDLDVVGVGRTADSILVNEAAEAEAAALLSPAYAEQHPWTASYTVAVVDLAGGGSASELVSAVRNDLPGVDVGPTDQAGRRAAFAAAVRPYWLALAFAAAVLGLAAVAALGPALVRVVDDELSDRHALRAIGAARRQLVTSAIARPAAIAVAGALLGVVLAVALSSQFPIGPARSAEGDPGTEVHLAGLSLGAVAVVLAAVVAALARAVVLTQRSVARRARPSALLATAGSAGLSPTALTGLHAAFGYGRSRRWPAVVGTACALAMAIAAVSFGSGLSRLTGDPARFGWTWDVLFENYDTPFDADLAAGLRDDDDVLGLVPISRGSVTLDGKPVPAIGMDLETAGDVAPAILEGRAPRAAGEIALGALTADELGVGVGDRVRGQATGGEPLRLEVVGTAVVPSIHLDETNQLGEGAFLVADDYEQLAGWFPSAALAEVRAGVTTGELEERHFTSALGVQRPADIISYDGVDGVPTLLAVVLAALAVVVLLHVLVGSVRQRRMELGVLRAIGLRPRQVAATVVWQTGAQVLLVAVVAVPAGVVVSRLAWRWFADAIGIAPDPSIPLGVVAVATVTVVAVSMLVCMLPARRAGSVHPADVLRAE